MEAFDRPFDFGPYKLYAKVAAGGMAEVFLATCSKPEFHNQFIAIKKLHSSLNANKPFVNLLVHEAKVGVLLTHPSIAEVYDLGSHRSEFFLAMEYIHGKSLDKVLKKVREGIAPLPPKDVASYVMFEILRALAFAHALKDVKGRELNIIHRDISPGNVLLEYKGNVKITDFGIATAENRLHVEFSNVAMGKMVYIPPEQAVNDPVHRASDLYSLSVVYYELLTGRLPFESDSPSGIYREIVAGKFSEVRESRPEISKELSDLIHKNLDKSTRKRFQSAPEMFEAFHRYFLEKEDLDFNSRAIRAYFKKKLAEYLRRCFESEIIEELEIIQEALRMAEEQEDLEATKEHEIPPEELLAEFNQPGEATVFEPDHTNEATRHYPLTEDERKKIIMGLSPREAMVEAGEFEQISPSAFEQATVPEFRMPTNARAKEKMEAMSISKDEREVLRHSEPAFEIMNSDDLEAFEQNTFTGKKDKTIVLTEDFAITSEQHGIEDQRTRVRLEGSDFPTAGPDEPTPQDLPLNAKSNPSAVSKSKKFTIDTSVFLKKFLGPVAVGLVICGLGFGIYQAREIIAEKALDLYSRAKVSISLHQSLMFSPTQQIAILFTGETDFQTQKETVRKFQEGENSVQKIEDFFNKIYSETTNSKEKVLSLLAAEPQLIRNPLSLMPQLSTILEDGKVFLDLESEGFVNKNPFHASIVVYIYNPKDQTSSQIPDEFSGKRTNRMGLVFYSPQNESLAALAVKVAREIARIYGAKDRIEKDTNLPMVPRGLGEPTKEPLFPQTKAELMGRWIMIDNLQKKEIQNLDELLVGSDTMLEWNWKKSAPTKN